jgi:hypothetical protein
MVVSHRMTPIVADADKPRHSADATMLRYQDVWPIDRRLTSWVESNYRLFAWRAMMESCVVLVDQVLSVHSHEPSRLMQAPYNDGPPIKVESWDKNEF